MAGLSGLFWLAMNKQSAQDRLDITLVHLSTPHELGRGVWWSESAVSLRTTRTPSVNKQDSSSNQRGLFPASASPAGQPPKAPLTRALLHSAFQNVNPLPLLNYPEEWRDLREEREGVGEGDGERVGVGDEEREGVGEGDGERGSGRERERT